MPARTADSTVRTRRAYSLPGSQRALFLAMAAASLAAGAFFLRDAADLFALEPIVVASALLLVIAGLFVGLSVLRARVILDGDRLEFRSALRTARVSRDEIDGLDKAKNAYIEWTRIHLKGDRRPLGVPGWLMRYDDLEQWVTGLPSRQRTSVGAAQEEVARKPDTWRIRLTVAAGVACAAAAVPYNPIYASGMVALLIFPPLAVFLSRRFPLLFTAFKVKDDPRSDLGLLIMAPAIGVMLSWIFDSDPSRIVDPTSLLPSFALIFLAFFVSTAGIVWKSPARQRALLGVLLFGVMYSVAVVNALDTIPDNSSASFFRTRIMKKRQVNGRRSTTYYLRVGPWGPNTSANDVRVPVGTYRRSAIGDPACLALRSGFLHAPWYMLVPCAGVNAIDAALPVPESASDAAALLPDAQRNAAQHPGDAHAQFVLGTCFVQLKRYAEAVPHLRAAVALDSTNGDAQHNLAWTYLKLKDLPDAERTYDAVVRLEPQSGQAAYEYAWVLLREHGASAAEEQTARALQLDPKNGPIQVFAGSLFRREARFADARQHFEAATRLLPNDPVIWAELGATDYLRKDRAAAAAAFAESARLDSNVVRSQPGFLLMWRDVARGSAR